MEYERFEVRDPMFGASNVYVIGETLVDTGSIPKSAGSVAPIERDLDETVLANVDRVVITHPHVDHIGGSEIGDRTDVADGSTRGVRGSRDRAH